MKVVYTIFVLLVYCSTVQPCQAQHGEISGKITVEHSNEGLPFANVYIEVNGLPRGAQTDFDGFYSIKPVPPGTYDLTVEYIGYQKQSITGVEVRADEISFIDVKLKEDSQMLYEVEIVEYAVPLIQENSGSTTYTFNSRSRGGGGRSSSGNRRNKTQKVTSQNIANLPTRNVGSIASTTAGVHQNDTNADLNIKGSRAEQTVYFIDGIKVQCNSKVITEPEKKNKEKLPQAKLHSLLTAGEIHDFSKWEMWEDISGDILSKHKRTWEIQPEQRYALQLMNEQKFPLVDRKVFLKNRDGKILWQARTDNLGKAELWLNLFTEQNYNNENLLIEVQGRETVEQLFDPKTYKEGINYIVLEEICETPNNMDVMLVVDATGSMSDEIEYLKSDFVNVMDYVTDQYEQLNINWGSVFYRAYGNDRMIEPTDFTNNTADAIQTIRNQNASNGGEEALDEAMLQAVKNMSWREDAVARILFLIADEPPPYTSNSKSKMKEMLDLAAQKGIRIIPLASSGLDKSCEYLMRSMALATNGTYTFLTDDSGIGNSHIKPTTDKYKVEVLNDLLLRLFEQYTNSTNCEVATENANSDTSASSNEHSIDLHNVKLFPNPAIDIITVELEEKTDELYIADINGKLLLRKSNISKGDHKIDLSAFPVGSYILVTVKKGKALSSKFIVVGK